MVVPEVTVLMVANAIPTGAEPADSAEPAEPAETQLAAASLSAAAS
jgi:hypothetical protein